MSLQSKPLTVPLKTLVVSAWWPEQQALYENVAGLAPGAATQPPAEGSVLEACQGQVLFACIGVGAIVSAARLAKIMCEQPRVQQIFFCGTAGAYNPAVEIGKAFVCSTVVWSDAGLVQGQAYLPRLQRPSPELSTDAYTVLRSRHAGILPASNVTCLCSSGITTDPALANTYGRLAELENLELFSVATVALAHNLPWLGFLGVSNSVGPTAHEQWKAHHLTASHAAQKALYAAMLGGGGSSPPEPMSSAT